MGKLGRDHTSFIIAPRRSTNRDAELMARHLTDAGDIRSLHLGEQVEAEILWQAVDLLSGVANYAFDEPGRATIGAGAVVVRLHGPLSPPSKIVGGRGP